MRTRLDQYERTEHQLQSLYNANEQGAIDDATYETEAIFYSNHSVSDYLDTDALINKLTMLEPDQRPKFHAALYSYMFKRVVEDGMQQRNWEAEEIELPEILR